MKEGQGVGFCGMKRWEGVPGERREEIEGDWDELGNAWRSKVGVVTKRSIRQTKELFKGGLKDLLQGMLGSRRSYLWG